MIHTRTITLWIEDDAEAGYGAMIPELPGVCSQGETRQEAEANLADALACVLASYAEKKDSVPWRKMESWTTGPGGGSFAFPHNEPDLYEGDK